MTQNDAELIQHSLQGDQDAFGCLVKKYQKAVHALAWRKIGDFHIAQEITQDAFLKAYKNLGDLKNHNLFAGWLYVIAARLCYDWRQKNATPVASLDNIDASEVDKVSYSRYTAEKQAAEADETRREVVKKLLQKLPESERTVITLFYLGEMTINAIGEFLGVSPNTVKSRLSRARNRLKKEEDMIQQNLSSFQLPANLTTNIMREVSRIVPTTPAANKPMLPWTLSAASAVLIFLLIGVGTQYLSRFQRPYNLNATSEPTVEIIEAVFVLDSPAKPAVRNQVGSSITPGNNPGAGQKPDAQRFAAALPDETEVSTPKPQWTQTKGPEGATVNTIFATTSGDIYAGTPTSLYKLSDDQRAWRLVNAKTETSGSLHEWLISGGQIVEHNDTLYAATDTKILASTDSGSTWNSLRSHPKGVPVGLAITDAGFYLALMDGIYHAKDGKAPWVPLKNGLDANRVHALAAVESTVFAGTDNGLYRLGADSWERTSIRPEGVSTEKPSIYALAVAEHRLYVAAGEAFTNWVELRSKSSNAWWSLYRSTDSGDSWYSIDPWERLENETKKNRKDRFPFGFIDIQDEDGTSLRETLSQIKIVAAEERVMVVDANGELFHSINTGETWNFLDLKIGSYYGSAPPVLMLNKNTFYRGVPPGVQRTTDGGKSWHQFNTGFVDTTVTTLIAVSGKLYANSMAGFVTSVDGGESWTPLPGGIDDGVFIKAFDGVLYVKKGNDMNSPSPLLRLSTEDHIPKFIPGMPAFGKIGPGNTVRASVQITPDEEMLKIMLAAATDKSKQEIEDLDYNELFGELKDIGPDQLIEALKNNIDFQRLKNEALSKALKEPASSGMMSFFGNFVVNDDTYYVEYQQRLFRWKPGMTEWHDTGLKDEAEPPDLSNLYSGEYAEMTNLLQSLGVKLAVSGKTLYVGKRDGHLFHSFDEGDTWNDVTADLPFSVAAYNTVAFVGSTVYVATDKGVAYSSDGTRWHKITDAEGTPLVIEKFAVDGTTLYGATEQQVYELKENSSTWKQLTPESPSMITAFTVDDNTLYVGTLGRGVLRFALDE